MAKWKKQTFGLKANHTWRTRAGFRICVMGRGAVRFDFPREWTMEPGTPSFKFYDREPPEDDIRLEASYNQIPPADWSKFPLSRLLDDVVTGDHRKLTPKGKLNSIERNDVRLLWREVRFRDPVEEREAYSRIAIGLGRAVQVLITMEFWPEDAGRATPVWDEALRSLKLEQYISDPTQGTPAGSG